MTTDRTNDPAWLAELPRSELPDLDALADADAARVAELLASVGDQPDLSGVAGRQVADEANAPVRSRRAVREWDHANRKRMVVEMRQAGLTFDEIGERLGVSREATRKCYGSALKDHYRAAAEEERETVLLRCNGLIRRWWPKMVQTDDDALADMASRNIFRALNLQADLGGMKRVAANVTVNPPIRLPTGPEVWMRVQELRAQAAADNDVIPRVIH